VLAGGHAGPRELARFRIEAEAVARLQHPNIVQIHEVGEAGGRPYCALEFVEGGNLAGKIDGKPMPAREAARLVEALARAMQLAHSRNAVHRDLKPANILLTADGTPKITDFGLARQLDSDSGETQAGAVMGTPSYIAPEQASGHAHEARPAADIYALGAILYACLAGRPPFQGTTVVETLDQVRTQEPVAPSRWQASVPLDLETICLKCLRKEPEKRYASTAELADDLVRYQEGEPIRARPVGHLERGVKWVKRNPGVAGAALAVVLALLIGIGLSTWQAARARAAELRADVRRQEAEREKERADLSQQQSRRLLYASDMNLAQQSLKLNNLGRARRLLDRHRPQPGEEDLRGWEWRYLWQLTRSSALATLTNRPVRGFNLSFSPDGSRLAVGWADGHVDLWDVPGRRWIRALTHREQTSWGLLAFSPVRNDLADTTEPTVVTLYDLDSGRESVLWRAPQEGSWSVRNLSFSQDGSRVVIYTAAAGKVGEVWVVNVSSATVESRHSTHFYSTGFFGAACLAPDNRRLYLAHSDQADERYSIQCLDLATNQEIWQTETQRDAGVATLAISPDGKVLVSSSGFADPAIRVWDAATGRLLQQLDGHTAWVCNLVLSRDGRQLISAASDQTIRFWDNGTWTETRVLRGHSDEVQAIAISPTEQLVASASKDGDLMLWKADGGSAADGYRRLPEDLRSAAVGPQDHSRVLFLPKGNPPHLVDLKQDAPAFLLTEIGSGTNVLGWFGTNILCQWDGANRIIVRELHGTKFTQRGVIAVESGQRPSRVAYNVARQSLAWVEGPTSTSVFVASLAAPRRRIELKSDVPGLVPDGFSDDGKYLVAVPTASDTLLLLPKRDALRAWDVETGQIVASINETLTHTTFAAEGRVLVVAIPKRANYDNHEIAFFDLTHPDQAPRRCGGKLTVYSLAVSPDGGLVAASTEAGLVRLFDPAKGELIESLHGHLNSAISLDFSADGRRLISGGGAREAIKLWDVGTRQELLTLAGTGSVLRVARWTADGDVILAGPPWQFWRAPSWEEIAAAEAKESKVAQRP
ncbi:MAG: WD40 repeat domain-containing serine/threonine-protein kinase, partial [Isosphaeraceae bacterium]